MNALNSAVRSTVLMVVALFALVITAERTALAQRTPSSIQRRVEQLNRQGEEFERDKLGREVRGEAGKNDRRQSQILVAEVRKDLESLQAGYNQIVKAMAAQKSPEDQQILDAVLHIKESASRLKHNLALPQTKDPAQKAPATAEIRVEPPLMVLRKHIYDFVMSPLFESPAVLNVEQAQKASYDLDKIIEASESISKHPGKRKSSS